MWVNVITMNYIKLYNFIIKIKYHFKKCKGTRQVLTTIYVIIVSYLPKSSCWIPNSGAGTVSDSFIGFLHPTPHNMSPCPALIHEMSSVLWQLVMPHFVDISMRDLPFPEWKWRRSGLGVRTERMWGEVLGGEEEG